MIISCQVQRYAWGKKGSQSEVARLKSESDPTFALNEEDCYAELWMGTHPSAPAKMANGQLFSEYLRNIGSSAVGFVPEGYDPTDLPFLFKVLSIRTALSIQAHPDKELASQLHSAFPDIYKDPNHKPEMAIALTPFEALCGFRSTTEIKQHILWFPELVGIIGDEVIARFSSLSENSSIVEQSECIRIMFTAFMTCEESAVQSAIETILKRIGVEGDEHHTITPKFDSLTELKSLIQRLDKDYPRDRGILCPLLLNFLILQPGESFFMGPNEPHAYISGDCVECMALSDNVVRAGLTPKYKDVWTLCSMLHYRCNTPSRLRAVTLDEHTQLYRPPVDICAEFEVEMISLPPNTVAYTIRELPCCSLVLVAIGSCSTSTNISYSPGTVIFIAANEKLVISSTCEFSSTLFRAHANLGKPS